MAKRSLPEETVEIPSKDPRTDEHTAENAFFRFNQEIETCNLPKIDTMISKGLLQLLDEPQKRSLLCKAARHCFHPILQSLLRAGISPFIRTQPNGPTPLHIAAGCFTVDPKNKDKSIRLILSAGCSVNDTMFNGQTALHLCAYHGDLRTTSTLLNHGADPNRELDTGITALHLAMKPEIAKILLRHGANPNARNYTGLTPLHSAVQTHNLEVAKVLLQNRASPDSLSTRGKTPLMLACEDTTIQPDFIRLLVEYNASMNLFNLNGFTPFHSAISNNFEAAADLFLQLGIDPTIQTKENPPRTCFQIATSNPLASRLHFCYNAKRGNIDSIKETILSENPIPPFNLWVHLIPLRKRDELRHWIDLTRALEQTMFATFFNETVDDETSMQSEVFGPVAELLAEHGTITSAKSRLEIKLLQLFFNF